MLTYATRPLVFWDHEVEDLRALGTRRRACLGRRNAAQRRGGAPLMFELCRFFNALQIRGQGRALHVFFLRAFWCRRSTIGPLDSQLAATILQTGSSRRSTTTDEKYHPSTAPPSCSLTRTARRVPLTRPQTVTSCAMTLPSICAPSPMRRSEARNSPSIRPKTCAGPLAIDLPTIDMSEPMQEAVPAFVVGSSLAAACSTTEICGCAILPMLRPHLPSRSYPSRVPYS
jgi:hypothetical protein